MLEWLTHVIASLPLRSHAESWSSSVGWAAAYTPVIAMPTATGLWILSESATAQSNSRLSQGLRDWHMSIVSAKVSSAPSLGAVGATLASARLPLPRSARLRE